MTRTHFLLFTAAGLALLALVSGGLPQSPGGHPGSPGGHPGSPGSAVLPSTAPAGHRTALAQASAGALSVDARLSSDRVLAGSSTMYVEVNVAAAAAERRAERLPVNLALALDRSGSMSGNKLAQAKRAALALVEALKDGDRLAVVSFGSDVRVFPSTLVTGSSRADLRNFVEQIVDQGGTNISGALESATEEVKRHREGYRVSRIILLSDGQPTEGLTSPSDLKRLVQRAREEQISTSAFGVGLDFNSQLMSDLANGGAGHYAFIEDASQLASLFERDLETAAGTVARQVELWLKPRPGVALVDVPGYEWSPSGAGFRVGLYDFAHGQKAQALLKLELAGVPAEGRFPLGELSLRYVGAENGLVKEAPLSLAAEATGRAGEVQAHSDAKVLELAQRMDITRHLAAAASAYESGDRTKALGIFDGIRKQFGMSADALAGDDLAATERQLRAGDAEGARAAKSLTNKTMRNFGQNNVYH